MQFDFDVDNSQQKIDMLPLIDVVFLVLVVFIYSFISMKVIDVVDVELPNASPTMKEVLDPLVISIDKNSSYFYKKEKLSLSEICVRVKEDIKLTGRSLLINGDKTSHLGSAISLIEGLKKQGVEDVSFLCERNKDAPK